MNKKSKKKESPKSGPEPDRLKLDGDWTDLIKKALEKKPPEEILRKVEVKSESKTDSMDDDT